MGPSDSEGSGGRTEPRMLIGVPLGAFQSARHPGLPRAVSVPLLSSPFSFSPRCPRHGHPASLSDAESLYCGASLSSEGSWRPVCCRNEFADTRVPAVHTYGLRRLGSGRPATCNRNTATFTPGRRHKPVIKPKAPAACRTSSRSEGRRTPSASASNSDIIVRTVSCRKAYESAVLCTCSRNHARRATSAPTV